MNDVLAVVDAKKKFASTTALAGAAFDLRQGEWLALLGPNGAGKTTLIRAIAGRVRLDEGRVVLLGRDITRPSAEATAARKRLGVVPQETALYPRLTAVENLEVFGALSGLAGALLRERVAWALEFTGLAERAQEQIGTFSGGMKRRLNIACGVLHRPEVVLLDEPTVGVDPQSRQRIAEMLRDLQQNGASLVLTTHQLDEVQQLCGRIVIIDHGRVIAAGTLEQLIGQTIGRQRRVSVTTDRPVPPDLLDDKAEIDGRTAHYRVEDVGFELPTLLARVRAAGLSVNDVAVQAPTLHEVFIHLTGRELRE